VEAGRGGALQVAVVAERRDTPEVGGEVTARGGAAASAHLAAGVCAGKRVRWVGLDLNGAAAGPEGDGGGGIDLMQLRVRGRTGGGERRETAEVEERERRRRPIWRLGRSGVEKAMVEFRWVGIDGISDFSGLTRPAC
jgi:hypothetical protein